MGVDVLRPRMKLMTEIEKSRQGRKNENAEEAEGYTTGDVVEFEGNIEGGEFEVSGDDENETAGL